MVPIKSNHHPNQYPPSDHAEIKSQPFKLPKITALMAVQGGYLRFLSWWFYSTFFLPMISACRWLSPHYLPSSAPTLPLSLSTLILFPPSRHRSTLSDDPPPPPPPISLPSSAILDCGVTEGIMLGD
ncbi:hypothetical protein HanRHA438_Chr03g0125041 [Helianthus annuus]|nr:hypothetical protein HanRHA438_Chr03g0125041 [Helianthus annuus]